MAITRYTASADNTITNAFDSTIQIRGTGSNMGAADVIEVFSLYAQDSSSVGFSNELSRGLIKFDVASIIADRNNKKIPASGEMKFFLNIYNCPHSKTLPKEYKYTIAKVTADWEEGYGLDMDEYKDKTYEGVGSNWIDRMGTDIPEISKITFSSDSKSDYSADTGDNYVKIYDGTAVYPFWFNATDAAIYETSSYEFKSNTNTDYLWADTNGYVRIYDGTDAYDFWFGHDGIKEISSFEFKSDTNTDYLYDDSSGYISLYDGTTQKKVWFGHDAIGSTATFTFDNTDYNTAANSKIKIINTAGTPIEYIAKASGANAASKEFNLGGNAQDAASNLVALINGSNGHNGTISAAAPGAGVVNLTQSVGGTAGDKAITPSAAEAASMTFKFDHSNHNIAPGSKITLVAGGKTVEYEFVAYGTPGPLGPTQIELRTNNKFTAQAFFDKVTTDAVNGHGGKLTGAANDTLDTPEDGKVILTHVTAGDAGNTTITTSTAVSAAADLTMQSGDVMRVTSGGPDHLAKNTKTVTLVVDNLDYLPGNEIRLNFSESSGDITIQVTPNNGINGNSGTPVTMTVAQLAEYIRANTITGYSGTVVVQSGASVLSSISAIMQSGTGGTTLADGGEGDNIVGTFAGGLNAFDLSTVINPPAAFTGGIDAFNDSTSTNPPAAFSGGRNADAFGGGTDEIDITGLATKEAYAGAFKDYITANLGSNFTANLVGSTVHVTSSTAGVSTDSSVNTINASKLAYTKTRNGRNADSASGLTNATEIDITDLATSGSYASKFKDIVHAHSKFTATVSGDTVTVFHADAAGVSTDTSIGSISASHLTSSVTTQGVDIVYDTSGSLSAATEVDIQNLTTSGSIAEAFYSASHAHSQFSANLVDNVVYVTSSATEPMTEISKVGSLAGLSVAVQQSGSLTTPWTNYGGDYSTAAGDFVDFTLSDGDEDISVDITSIVEGWITTPTSNYGLIIKLSSSYEPYYSSSTGTDSALAFHNPSGARRSYYTKKLFGRGTEFYFKKPNIEGRWDDTRRDNRINFYLSSSVAPASDNVNSLYYYNYIRGSLQDIAGDNSLVPTVKFHYSSGSVPEGSAISFRDSSNNVVTSVSATRVSKGIYRAQAVVTSSAVTDTYPYLVDVWSYSSTEIHSGSAFEPKEFNFSNENLSPSYVVSAKNLKEYYDHDETARFRFYIRDKNWNPTVYTKAVKTPETKAIESGSYSIARVVDKKVVLPHGTGSVKYTSLSYDSSGSYFDLNMKLLEPGYMYEINLSFYEDSIGSYVDHPHRFKFRVKQNEY
tara:strand:- start:2314 stop:6180 length:3867 start_codon:yes stop_codon:yes gene_type:complete